MNTRTVTIPNISCGHCTHTIESEVADLEGVTLAEASQTEKTLKVEWTEPATWETIEELLKEINYPPSGD